MRTQALHYLACPCCGGTLMADAGTTEADGHVMSGALVSACGVRFPIRNGVPRFVPRAENVDASTPQACYQRFEAPAREQRLLEWLAPLPPSHLADRAVLELGSDHGRYTALMAGYGARSVVAVESCAAPDDALEHTFAATRHLPNAHVVAGDVTRPPVGRVFDLGVALGALSYLPDPVLGFHGLYDRVAVGGRIALWVYGQASSPRVTRSVARLRHALTGHLPGALLSWVAWPPAVLLSAAVRVCQHPTVAARLPHGADLRALGDLLPREVHRMLMGQAHMSTAHQLHRSEVERWLHTPDLEDTQLAWHRDHAWQVTAIVCGHAHSIASPAPMPPHRASPGATRGTSDRS